MFVCFDRSQKSACCFDDNQLFCCISVLEAESSSSRANNRRFLLLEMPAKCNLTKFAFNYRLIFSSILVLSYLFVQQYFVLHSVQLNDSTHKNGPVQAPVMHHIVKSHDRKLFAKRSVKRKRKRHRSEYLADIKIDFPSISNEGFYNLNNKTAAFYSQINQDKILEYLLNSTGLPIDPNGFFIEAGAYDGEQWSNTLHFERFHNWSGLLIEPSRESFRLLKKKNRKLSYLINSCLCGGKSTSQTVKRYYVDAGPFGITCENCRTNTTSFNDDSIYTVKCHTLDNILKKLLFVKPSIRHIDYMSLDVEGELEFRSSIFVEH
jgi:hypothetical protein